LSLKQVVEKSQQNKFDGRQGRENQMSVENVYKGKKVT
jgi:hypothetical protein